ncbi:MAG: hypothetical protein U0X93_03295 [Anaerolineales bacterium]
MHSARSHQLENAAAYAALKASGLDVSDEAIQKGFAQSNGERDLKSRGESRLSFLIRRTTKTRL